MTEINHTEYPKSLKGRSNDALRYTIADATAAMLAMPEGDKAGYYADEVHYCAMELKSREVVKYRIEKRIHPQYMGSIDGNGGAKAPYWCYLFTLESKAKAKDFVASSMHNLRIVEVRS